jgi:YidC/Oxa1 family membrane protein insertase
MNEIIIKRNLKTRAFKSKYLFIKKLIEKNKHQNFEIDVLIAPSWNSSFYKLGCHILLKKFLIENKISFKLRVHPMSFIKKEISIKEIKQLDIPIDSLNMLNLFKYKYLITDWSGAFIEYAMIFKKKAFLINTPKKIVNQNYLKYENQPIEITLRNILGKTYDIENIKEIASTIKILSQKKNKKELIEKDENVEKIINQNFFI